MKKVLFAVVFLSFTAMGFGAVVLNENFDSDGGNWNGVLGSTYQITGGSMVLTSDSSNSIKWAIRSDVQIKNFVLTVRTQASQLHKDAALGISIRTQSNADSYWFMIYPTGFFQVQKYINLTNTGVFQFVQRNTFIRSDINHLKIVAEEDTISFLCNSQLLCRIVDTSINGQGRIGLNTLGATATFDSLVVDDNVVNDYGLSSFSDAFTDPNLFGWGQFDATGTYSVTGGKLRAVGESNGYMGMLHTSGSYGSDDTVEVTATKVTTETSFNYGLMFHFNDNTNEGYVFIIIDGQGYTCTKLSGGSSTALFSPALSFDINATTNTLKVINAAGGQKQLYINNALQRTISDNTFTTGSSGVMVANTVTIDFDNFRISGQALTATEDAVLKIQDGVGLSMTAAPNPFNPAITIHVASVGAAPRHLVVYDLSGKKIADLTSRLNNDKAEWNASGMPSGLYVVRFTQGGKTLSQKIALMK